jgi:hypothetical protein
MGGYDAFTSLPHDHSVVGQELPSVTAHRVENADGTAATVLYMSRPGETPDPPQGRTRAARRTDDG